MDDRQAEFIGLSLVEEIRGWHRDELPRLRAESGDFVGDNATYAIIELYDAEGRLVDRSTARPLDRSTARPLDRALSARGHSPRRDRRTGDSLGLSPLTAKTHVSRIMGKPGARDRA